jgi:hypothetical protein
MSTATLPGIALPQSAPPTDYYSIHNDAGRFVCHVTARSGVDALRIARAHGLTLSRSSSAYRIGLDEYSRRVNATIRPRFPTSPATPAQKPAASGGTLATCR